MPVDPDYDWKVLPVDASGNATQAAAVAAGDTMANPTAEPVISHTAIYHSGAPDQWKRLRAAADFILDEVAGGTFFPTAKAIWNGATYDHEYSNYEATVYASAARTATPSATDLKNISGRGVTVVIDVTAASATPSVVVTIDGKCTLSGKYYNILTSAAITGIGTTTLRIYPDLTPSANVAVNSIVPRVFRIVVTHADADSITYSVSVNYHR